VLHIESTPSSGLNEVLAALRIERGRATSEGGVDYNRLLRHLPTHIDSAQLDTILAAAETSGYVQSDGHGGYALTTGGQTHLRANRPRGSRISVG